jgi:two-component system CheB/CheR fusion protein
LLPELLQRVTPMGVSEIRDRMPIEPDSVYVIPPNFDLAFADGMLALLHPSNQPGHRYPIDTFFKALAEEKRSHAAGIIFSGMGTDGTSGLRSIQEAGGVTLVQTPESAKFDAMPRSAIEAGVADVVALPGDMPERLWSAWAAEPNVLHGRGHARRHALRELLHLLQSHTGNNFSDYKMNTVLRRIERRMKLQQSESMEAYVHFLRDNPSEIELLFRELLIGVTSFFRDPKVWEHLRTTTIPEMLDSHPNGAAFKAWVPA